MSVKEKKLKCFLRIEERQLSIIKQPVSKLKNRILLNMSRSNVKQVQVQVKPFCKVCQDAGKSESEYTSHFVRASQEPNAKVICPTLLSQECKYCFKTGHTVKFCTVLVANNKAKERAIRKENYNNQSVQVQGKKPQSKSQSQSQSKFASLMSDSEDDEDEEVKVKSIISKKQEEFPALSSIATKVVETGSTTMSYASMASKTRNEYEDEQYVMKNAMKRQVPPITKALPEYNEETYNKLLDNAEEYYAMSEEYDRIYDAAATQVKKTKKASEINWASWDSDSEDEDW